MFPGATMAADVDSVAVVMIGGATFATPVRFRLFGTAPLLTISAPNSSASRK
jgi:hypothetical protein